MAALVSHACTGLRVADGAGLALQVHREGWRPEECAEDAFPIQETRVGGCLARAQLGSLALRVSCWDARSLLTSCKCSNLQVADFLNGRWTWADARQLLMPTPGPSTSGGLGGRGGRRESILTRSAARPGPDLGSTSQRSSAVGGSGLHSTSSMPVSAAELAEVRCTAWRPLAA